MPKSKLNANPVGANCIRPRFEGMTQNKGITLIALIITIIVMLILVGVTINVALNGGLFSKAETAATQTKTEAIREQLQDLILGKMDNSLKIQADLGTIKIEGDIYAVTAENVDGSIKINLTKDGDTTPKYAYDLVSDIKITGVTLKQTDPEPVSVAGTYGGGIFVVSDDGTAVYHGQNATYTIDENLKGTMTIGDEQYTIQFEIKEDGTKVLYFMEITSHTNTNLDFEITTPFYSQIYTTQEINVFSQVSDITYIAGDASNVTEIEFKDGNAILKKSDGTTTNGKQNCFIAGDTIYYCESETFYVAWYMLHDGKIYELWG